MDTIALATSKKVYDAVLVKKAYDALDGSGSEALEKLYKRMLSESAERFVVKPSKPSNLDAMFPLSEDGRHVPLTRVPIFSSLF